MINLSCGGDQLIHLFANRRSASLPRPVSLTVTLPDFLVLSLFIRQTPSPPPPGKTVRLISHMVSPQKVYHEPLRFFHPGAGCSKMSSKPQTVYLQ